jgi:hypothetical protein
MVTNNKCERCEEIETYKHLLWECRESKRIWQHFNEFAVKENQLKERVIEYDNVFTIGNISNINKLKVKVIQEMIRIERPINWTISNIIRIATEIKSIEEYNAIKNG